MIIIVWQSHKNLFGELSIKNLIIKWWWFWWLTFDQKERKKFFFFAKLASSFHRFTAFFNQNCQILSNQSIKKQTWSIYFHLLSSSDRTGQDSSKKDSFFTQPLSHSDNDDDYCLLACLFYHHPTSIPELNEKQKFQKKITYKVKSFFK